ncbi:MFS transporter [Aquabacterium sp.]|uniref:MFS transporter n=1 Tax=Aquabacterium sp. TaxID=1872578 RepID=UPI0024877556|nr:MFS transporter [Aquabacterium sp.]MDI1259988.1 MFS transporter [Aquabacterium sp.]
MSLKRGTVAPAHAADLPRPLVLLLASGAGLAVASIYYSQPMLAVLAGALGANARDTGFVPTLTQLGYALGILLLAPLGDRFDRRQLILVKTALLAAALLATGLAPGLPSLLAASLVVGLTATLAQDIVPAAATLAPESSRGKTVGTVMTGLLLGILLSRVASGFIAERWGWRMVYELAAASLVVFGLAAWRGLPRLPVTSHMSYAQLMGSLAKLWRQHAELRRAALAQGLLSMGFSAFWSTMAVMLHHQYHLGSEAAGYFGLAGAAGALAAPLAGRLADQRGPELVTRLGAGLAMVSFAVMGLGMFLTREAQIGLILAATVGFDFGIQATLVAHQTVVYSLAPAARSRLNALLFTGMFIGMSAGAALGSLALARWGWMGVVALATVAAGASLAVRLSRRHGAR